MNKLAIIEKINLLESKLENDILHPLMEPFKFDSLNIIEIQEAGKKIAHHIGLASFNFIISYAQQNKNVAGQIETDQGRDIFIEIDGEYSRDIDSVLAVLSHEICHKYLQVYNLKLLPEYENELLTDVATVYTGLGKLSLNGCKKMSFSASKTDNSTTITTKTNNIGYMDRQQFAFTYRVICEMRMVNESEMMQGLSAEAKEEVKNIYLGNIDYFNKKYFSNDFILQNISDTLSDEIAYAQKQFALFYKNIRIIQESVLPLYIQQYISFHSYLKSKLETIKYTSYKSYSTNEQNYIRNLMLFEEINVLKLDCLNKVNEIRINKQNLSNFLDTVIYDNSDQFLSNNFDYLLQFQCPVCGQIIKINEKVLAKVKCSNPKCNYKFIVDIREGLTDNQFIKDNDETRRNKILLKLKNIYSLLFNRS